MPSVPARWLMAWNWEIAERDLLHFAIGPMVVDPVLVAAEPVACVQDRQVRVGDPGQFIEPGRPPKHPGDQNEVSNRPKIIRLEIKPDKIAQAAVRSRRNFGRRNPARCDWRRDPDPAVWRLSNDLWDGIAVHY